MVFIFLLQLSRDGKPMKIPHLSVFDDIKKTTTHFAIKACRNESKNVSSGSTLAWLVSRRRTKIHLLGQNCNVKAGWRRGSLIRRCPCNPDHNWLITNEKFGGKRRMSIPAKASSWERQELSVIYQVFNNNKFISFNLFFNLVERRQCKLLSFKAIQMLERRVWLNKQDRRSFWQN